MSMSLTTEPSNDGPTVTEGLIYHYFFFSHINFSLCHLSLCSEVCVSQSVCGQSDIIHVCNPLESALAVKFCHPVAKKKKDKITCLERFHVKL